MPWYHVCISHWTGKTTRSEVKLDLTHEDLRLRIVEPYVVGFPITINGKTIQLEDVERVKITITDQDSTYLRVTAERIAASSPFRTVGGVEYYIANSMGTDVSDEFITGPPGTGPKSEASLVGQQAPANESRNVFVIHGRNTLARDAIFEFLRSIDLHPLEWSEVVEFTGKTAPYVGEILDAAFSRAHAVIVLLTPDDEARLRQQFRAENEPSHETHLIGQARPNALFEAGMAMGRSEDRTVLVELGKLRPFSDVAGRHAIRINNSTTRRQELAQRLRSAGCPVNLEGTSWHSAGDFEAAIAVAGPEETEPSNGGVQQPTNVSPPEMLEDSIALLVAAAGNNGVILRMLGDGRPVFKAGSCEFGEFTDPRSRERWEYALGQLLQNDYIRGPIEGRRRFELTHIGFELADRIAKSQQTGEVE